MDDASVSFKYDGQNHERCDACPEVIFSDGFKCSEVIRGNCKRYLLEDMGGEVEVVEVEGWTPSQYRTDIMRDSYRIPMQSMVQQQRTFRRPIIDVELPD
jgi:hypothetical protein